MAVGWLRGKKAGLLLWGRAGRGGWLAAILQGGTGADALGAPVSESPLLF